MANVTGASGKTMADARNGMDISGGMTMRLIDADALMEFITQQAENPTDEVIASVCRGAALSMPTIDAVPVVRCKDCVGKATWYKDGCGVTVCGTSSFYVVEDNDFCSYGERRADNG